MFEVGLTVVPDNGLLPPASLYHFTVPVEQLALRVVLWPVQIVEGVAFTLVGADGMSGLVRVAVVEPLQLFDVV